MRDADAKDLPTEPTEPSKLQPAAPMPMPSTAAMTKQVLEATERMERLVVQIAEKVGVK